MVRSVVEDMSASIRWNKEKELDMMRSITESRSRPFTENSEDLSNMNSITSLILHCNYPSIRKVIFSNPATIVFWNDGSKKTVVKCSDRDNFDPEKGLAMAIAKKFLGNKGNYYNTFVKYIPELRDKDDEQ